MTITAADMATTPGIDELHDEQVSVAEFPSDMGADLDSETLVTTSVGAAFLTAMMWAPADMARQVRDILAATERWNPFWSPAHRTIFDAVAAVLDGGAPPNPALVQAHLFEHGQLARVERELLAIIAPTHTPMVGGADLPHLAAKVIDQWYRRGYRGFITRMTQVVDTAGVEDLDGQWDVLNEHKRRAVSMWLTKRDQLARL